MVVMGLDLAWCCLRFEHCSQKASQSCGWNMDINGLTIMALTIWVGIYNLLEMDIGFTCMHHFFYSVLVFHYLLASIFAVWAPSHDTCASEYRCLPVVFPMLLDDWMDSRLNGFTSKWTGSSGLNGALFPAFDLLPIFF